MAAAVAPRVEPRTPAGGNHLKITINTSQTPEKCLCAVQEIPGKGLGLVARQAIAAGTIILKESPLITTASITSLSPTRTEFELSAALAALPPEKRQAYHSLHNNHAETDPAHPLAGIVRSNLYPLGVDASIGGIFQTISRINHSCRPNAVQYWNTVHSCETIYCVSPIQAGQEVTVSYHLGGPSTMRQRVLQENFGFQCRCELCLLPAPQLAISDKRLQRALELDNLIGNAERCTNEPSIVMAACAELFEIFELEQIRDGRLSRLFYDAFQLCNMHSDLARAKTFAEYFCEAKTIAEGPDSTSVIEMSAVSQNPQSHPSFGGSIRWRSRLSDQPKGLSQHEFQRWLWTRHLHL
ncbi:unnamed protein product [Blumeria hordei]|uniref:SET domain-containing protein n=2 Tax=Blumeria hordei TaxID=2867405 RepID=A0A383UKR2_BLUHO|nr:SET domain-containing protein [Blumeria hordei DH14]SZF00904.1 unnamed protein product [Blumeria hordei]